MYLLYKLYVNIELHYNMDIINSKIASSKIFSKTLVIAGRSKNIDHVDKLSLFII